MRSTLHSRLPFHVALALRYFWSTRRDAFTTFLSVVAVTAIMVGVLALILALSALSGFQDLLRTQVLAQTPDVEVSLPQEALRDDPEAAERAAEALRAVPGVEEVRPVVRGAGWLLYDGRTVPAKLVGFVGDSPPSFPGLQGSGEGLYMSRPLATSWGLDPGDTVEIVSPRPTLTPMGPQPRVRSVRLAGVFEPDRATAEGERAALPLDVAESLFGAGRRSLLVSVGTLERALEIEPALEAALPEGSEVATWKESNQALFFALDLERIFLFLGVSLIVVVASLALLADLALIIANKREDLGVLLTLGATPADLRRAFLWLGGLLALVGTGLGTLFGVGAALVLDRFQLIRLPGQIFFVDYIPFLVRPRDLATILVVTLALALLASLYAAGRAAHLDPIRAMRK